MGYRHVAADGPARIPGPLEPGAEAASSGARRGARRGGRHRPDGRDRRGEREATESLCGREDLRLPRIGPAVCGSRGDVRLVEPGDRGAGLGEREARAFGLLYYAHQRYGELTVTDGCQRRWVLRQNLSFPDEPAKLLSQAFRIPVALCQFLRAAGCPVRLLRHGHFVLWASSGRRAAIR